MTTPFSAWGGVGTLPTSSAEADQRLTDKEWWRKQNASFDQTTADARADTEKRLAEQAEREGFDAAERQAAYMKDFQEVQRLMRQKDITMAERNRLMQERNYLREQILKENQAIEAAGNAPPDDNEEEKEEEGPDETPPADDDLALTGDAEIAGVDGAEAAAGVGTEVAEGFGAAALNSGVLAYALTNAEVLGVMSATQTAAVTAFLASDGVAVASAGLGVAAAGLAAYALVDGVVQGTKHTYDTVKVRKARYAAAERIQSIVHLHNTDPVRYGLFVAEPAYRKHVMDDATRQAEHDFDDLTNPMQSGFGRYSPVNDQLDITPLQKYMRTGSELDSTLTQSDEAFFKSWDGKDSDYAGFKSSSEYYDSLGTASQTRIVSGRIVEPVADSNKEFRKSGDNLGFSGLMNAFDHANSGLINAHRVGTTTPATAPAASAAPAAATPAPAAPAATAPAPAPSKKEPSSSTDGNVEVLAEGSLIDVTPSNKDGAGPPVVIPPVVNPPVVGPPLVGPPVVNPPLVNPPVVNPPLVNPPVVGPPLVGPPLVNPPVVGPPVVKPPSYDPSALPVQTQPAPTVRTAPPVADLNLTEAARASKEANYYEKVPLGKLNTKSREVLCNMLLSMGFLGFVRVSSLTPSMGTIGDNPILRTFIDEADVEPEVAGGDPEPPYESMDGFDLDGYESESRETALVGAEERKDPESDAPSVQSF